MTAVSTSRLLRKLRPAEVAVDETSTCLFRLGEMCNNHCPMCSNTGRPEAFFVAREELLRRVERLHGAGFRRVVLTGGEPTIHPAFWDVVGALGERGIAWDINSHGRSFADPDFADRAIGSGLSRAIVSLHSHLVEASCEISGVHERAHRETVEGIANLASRGSWILLNLVLCRLNLDHVPAYLDWCAGRFGRGFRVKVTFPSTLGKGGGWEPIHLRYDEVRAPLRAARERARDLGIPLVFESIPNCVHGDARARHVSRSGFGETHYLDDVTGDRLYPIEHIESSLSVYGEACGRCRALRRCPGVSEAYARRYGTGELEPL